MHEVIAAIKIEPSLISNSELGTLEIEKFSFLVISLKLSLKLFAASVNKTLSCGLLGPEIVGTMVDISNVKVSVNSISLLAHKPCAFALFYATLGIPIAKYADYGNRRNLISFAIGVWSFMTALSGLAQNFFHLLIARIGVGIGEAGCSPPAHSMISEHRRFYKDLYYFIEK